MRIKLIHCVNVPANVYDGAALFPFVFQFGVIMISLGSKTSQPTDLVLLSANESRIEQVRLSISE